MPDLTDVPARAQKGKVCRLATSVGAGGCGGRLRPKPVTIAADPDDRSRPLDHDRCALSADRG